MDKASIAIIGGGNMGTCLIGGLIANGYPKEKLWVADPAAEKLKQLQRSLGVHTTTDNKVAGMNADVIILAVKQKTLLTVTAELTQPVKMRKTLIISIVAGIRESSLQQWLGGDVAIVRCMPNIPALIGSGASALYANHYVTPGQHALAESILRTVGIIVWLENEKDMDAVTALSGCGPAYFFLVMEALQQAGEELGLSKEIARLLTLQTAFGASRMALESEASAAELRKRVTSPGGSTEQALRVFEEKNIHKIFKQALQAAKERAEELAKSFDSSAESKT